MQRPRPDSSLPAGAWTSIVAADVREITENGAACLVNELSPDLPLITG